MLVLVINYTGDRIHFGLAVERARKEGIKVRRVTIFKDSVFFFLRLAYVFFTFFFCPYNVHVVFLLDTT